MLTCQGEGAIKAIVNPIVPSTELTPSFSIGETSFLVIAIPDGLSLVDIQSNIKLQHGVRSATANIEPKREDARSNIIASVVESRDHRFHFNGISIETLPLILSGH